MIRRNLLIYFRAISKNYFFFLLNTLGLAIGIAACILCFLHVQYERSYDNFNNHADQIFRIVTGDVDSGDGWVKVSAPIPPLLKEEIPEIEEFTRYAKITYNPKITVRHEESIFNEDKFYMADPSLFQIFDIPLVSGNKDNILHDPNSVVISRSTATRYFGKEDPIGKALRVNDQFDFEVEAVFEDVPDNSHFDFDFLIPFDNLERIFPGASLTGNWGQFNYFAYVQLFPGSDLPLVENKIRAIKIDLGDNSEFKLERLGLQRLRDIHFQDNRGNQKPAYNTKYLYIYTAVAFAILIISFINFINLSIAGSTKRVKEVGVRKVIGASRKQLVFQFVAESFMITTISVVIALVVISKLLLPVTNEVLHSNITISYTEPSFVASIFLLILIISLTSGSYIAFFVTSFQPSDALKGAFKIGSKGTGFKNILMGIQFSISIMLILGSVFVYNQLNFLRNKDIGMHPDQVLSVSLYNQEAREKAELLKDEYMKFSWVNEISASRFNAGSANWNQTVKWEGQQEDMSMFLILADENVIETLGLDLVEGDLNEITKPLAEGEVRYLLNESAVKVIGWDHAVNQPFTAFGGDRMGTVSGVVKDYNFRSLHHNIAPCAIVVTHRMAPSNLLIRLETNDYQHTIQELDHTFKQIVANTPFEYNFLDDQFQKLYESEMRTAKIVGFLTVIAITLALLGLYGLLTFVVQERTKEMAIRKVLGVRLSDIIYLLSSNFLKLLLIANLISIPVVWVIMTNWLDSFNYKIDLNFFVFLLTSLMIWLFVLITISFNVFQVSKINPVIGLKYE